MVCLVFLISFVVFVAVLLGSFLRLSHKLRITTVVFWASILISAIAYYCSKYTPWQIADFWIVSLTPGVIAAIVWIKQTIDDIHAADVKFNARGRSRMEYQPAPIPSRIRSQFIAVSLLLVSILLACPMSCLSTYPAYLVTYGRQAFQHPPLQRHIGNSQVEIRKEFGEPHDVRNSGSNAEWIYYSSPYDFSGTFIHFDESNTVLRIGIHD